MEAQREDILACLKAVRLPTQKVDVVEGGILSRLELSEKSLFVELKIPELNATFEKSLRYQAQKAVKEKFPEIEVAVEFIQGQPTKSPVTNAKSKPRIGTMIAIGSGKGGVGKSSVTVNLAVALKKLHYKVGILDCDLYGPSIPTMMGVEKARPMMLNGKIQPVDAHGIRIMSAGFFVEEDQGLIWRGPMIHKLIQQFYWDVDWEGTDVLLVDLPPGTGDAPLSLSQTMPLTGALMVSLPQKVSIIDVRKAYAMFQQVKVPVLGVVENMSEFICPNCDHTSEIFSRGGVKEFADQLGVPYLGDIPIDPKLRQLCDEGKPFLMEFESTAAGKAFMKVAERLTPVLRTADAAEDEIKLVM